MCFCTKQRGKKWVAGSFGVRNAQRDRRLITVGSCRLFATDHDRHNRRFPSRSNEHLYR